MAKNPATADHVVACLDRRGSLAVPDLPLLREPPALPRRGGQVPEHRTRRGTPAGRPYPHRPARSSDNAGSTRSASSLRLRATPSATGSPDWGHRRACARTARLSPALRAPWGCPCPGLWIDGPVVTGMRSCTVGQAALLLDVSADTARGWADAGRVAAHRDETGRRLIDGRDLAAFSVELARAGGGGQDAPSRTSVRNAFPLNRYRRPARRRGRSGGDPGRAAPAGVAADPRGRGGTGRGGRRGGHWAREVHHVRIDRA